MFNCRSTISGIGFVAVCAVVVGWSTLGQAADCSDAGLTSQIQALLDREINNAGDMGICESGRAALRVAEEEIRLLDACPNNAFVQLMRKDAESFRDSSKEQADGSCSP